MARTLANVLLEARYFIQDQVAPYRQSDEELEMYLKDAFGVMYTKRPDIFPPPTDGDGCSSAGVPEWDDLTEEFPLGNQWFRAAAYFVAASAEIKDEEHSSEGKAAFMFAQADKLMGISHG